MAITKNYAIHCDTYLIQTTYKDGKYYALVYEKGRQFYVETKPLKLIDSACRAIGTNFQTASENAKKILGNKLKVPIIVGFEDQSPFIMFPLYSPRSHHNIWIAYNTIINVVNHKKKITLTFRDDTQVDIPILISSFNNQYVSSAMLAISIEKNWKRFNAIN